MQIEITTDVVQALLNAACAASKKDHPVAHPFMVGSQWFIRTVTYHLVGKVTGVSGNFIHLEQASWVADSGRFMQAIQTGVLSEVEPVGTAVVNMESIADAFPWNHELPTEQK